MREIALAEVLEITETAMVPFNPQPVVTEITDSILEKQAIDQKIKQLRDMGFSTAAKKAEAAHKMVKAYGEYTFISPETIQKFNDKLKKETLKEDSRTRRYKTLVFIPIQDYNQVPPPHVLQAISEAKKKEIFDGFFVTKIDWKEEIKDPIVFGMIDGCDDIFFIAQWDDDVRLEDLLKV